jgi:beta-mannosidase
MFRLWFGVDPRALDIETFTYFAGLLQGEGLREYCDNFRRRMSTTTGAAVFWMFNDCWPTVRSWTVADYRKRRTPAFWSVRRALAPVHLSLVEEAGMVRVYGINDTPQAVRGRLRFGVMELAGRHSLDESRSVELPANGAHVVAEFPASAWHDRRASICFASLAGDGGTLTRNKLIDPLYKEMHWPKADVRMRREKHRVIFESDAFAWGVCLDLSGERALGDNFFDLWPGVPHEVAWDDHWGEPRVLHVGNALPGR